MVSFSLEHGNSDASCYAYVWWRMLAGLRFGNYQAGFRFGKLGYDLVERRGLQSYQARTHMDFGDFIMSMDETRQDRPATRCVAGSTPQIRSAMSLMPHTAATT